MENVFSLCLGILVIADGIVFLIGYILVAQGISDAMGPFLGVIAALTFFPIFLIGPLGIGTNPKITNGFGFIVTSIIVALAFAGLIWVLSPH